MLEFCCFERVAGIKRDLQEFLKKQKLVKDVWITDIEKYTEATRCLTGLIGSNSKALNICDFLKSVKEELRPIASKLVPPTHVDRPRIEFTDMSKEIKKRVKKAGHFASTQPLIHESKLHGKKEPKRTMEEPVGWNDNSSSASSTFSENDPENVKFFYKRAPHQSFASTTSVTMMQPKKKEENVSKMINHNRSNGSTLKTQAGPSHDFGQVVQKKMSPKANFKKQDLIPGPGLRNLDYLQAKIVYVDGLDNFRIIRTDEETTNKQKALDDEIQSYYKDRSTLKPAYNPRIRFFGCVSVDGILRRCVVTKVVNERAERLVVFLVDLGRYMEINGHELKLLHPQFYELKQGSIKCKLAHIIPKPGDDPKYPKKALKEFKKLSTRSNVEVRILVIKVPIFHNDPHLVTVLIFPNNGMKINLNALLVEKLDCAESTGIESQEMIKKDEYDEFPLKFKKLPITKDSKVEPDKRIEVDIVSIVNPSEFYVAHKKNGDFEALDAMIQSAGTFQETVQGILPANANLEINKAWQVNDLCLVKHSINKNDPHWFRGSIVEFKDSKTCNVFMLDKGLQVEADIESLFETKNLLLHQPPTVIKMHLFGVVPLAGNTTWNQSALGTFNSVKSRYEKFCISVVGEKNEAASLPVLLWGVTEQNYLMTTQTQYHDIRGYLLNEGLVDTNLKMTLDELILLERSFDFETGTVAKESKEPQDENIQEQDSVPQEIVEWIPAEPTKLAEFEGIPTNIDDDGIIYIQNNMQSMRVKEITTMLTSVYSKFDPQFHKAELKVGQPVIVQNVIVGGKLREIKNHCQVPNIKIFLEYFRGIIEKLPKKFSYKVRLVDIGTLESVYRQDIFTLVLASEVPIQCQKFRLSAVAPANREDAKWSSATLEHIHGGIVDMTAKVKVDKIGDVSECSIRVLERNLNYGALSGDFGTDLVEKGFARYQDADENWPPPEPKVFHVPHDHEEMEFKTKVEKNAELMNSLIKPSTIHFSPEETRTYLKRFEADLNADAASMLSVKSSRTSRSTDSRKGKKTSTPTSFDSVKNKLRPIRMKRPVKQIHFYDLRAADIEELEFKFAAVLEPTKLYVSPNITELVSKLEEMEKVLKTLKEAALVKFTSPEKSDQKVCLVKTCDGWKRAMINFVFDDLKTAEIFFVDSALCSKVPTNLLFKIPEKLLKYPKRTLIVTLNGLAFNTHHEKYEVEQSLEKLLTNQTFKAVVKGYDEKDYPLVDIVDENGALIYQKLIDNKDFVKT